MDKEKQVYALLDKLDIAYELFEHEPAHNMEEIDDVQKKIGGVYCKNLFLRNSKGDQHYLTLVEGSKRVDLRRLARIIESTRLSFASPERLMKYLGLVPGEVGPFGLINDSQKVVKLIIDQSIVDAERISFHPNNNAKTVVISYKNLLKFINWVGNEMIWIHL
ncbi:prolyl-tRNA synthetase associated domain-containing protein [Vallitalea okinawensis]|uniref:prolyl-tRNA synthetase associated domain-containing protein n=1 Tax=Vallitalea okinawensis TaxID=2078660 RepID=UPI000CFD473E|nr:prolyl-tRNA synthetase associated domain-containing protein [Vallitalea okinawensis]